MATGFYNPIAKAPTYKLPSMQSGANTLVNPYQTLKNTVNYNEGYQPVSANYGMTGPVVGSQNPGQPGGISPIQAKVGSNIPQIQAAPAAPTIPGASAADDQAYMYKLMNDDPMLSGELDALVGQNQASWASYLQQAKQAEIAYGGAYNPAAGQALGYNPAAYTPGVLTNTIPGSTHMLGTPSGSLAESLSDPAVLNSIAPGTGGYNVSALGQIANQFNTLNRTVDANLRSRGMYGSSSLGQHLNENLQQNQVAQNSALTNFLNALQGGYGTYLGNFGGLQNQQASDYQNTLNTIIAGIGSGAYTLPSVAAQRQAAALQAQQAQQPQDDPQYNDYGGYIPPVAYGTTPPATAWSPYTTPVTANWSGGSANKHQGVFAIH